MANANPCMPHAGGSLLLGAHIANVYMYMVVASMLHGGQPAAHPIVVFESTLYSSLCFKVN